MIKSLVLSKENKDNFLNKYVGLTYNKSANAVIFSDTADSTFVESENHNDDANHIDKHHDNHYNARDSI